MNIMEAVKARHSVRAYTDRRMVGAVREELQAYIKQCNEESGLHMQLILDEDTAFGGRMARYGKFSGVRNYIAVIGKKGCEEDCGYYGEKVVLKAQQLGLHTCWVGLTYKKVKSAYQIKEGEKLHLVIAVGYGAEPGKAHLSKPKEKVTDNWDQQPEWFQNGVACALLAPTALNQQKFHFSRNGMHVRAKAGFGSYSKVDLGIAKCHFEIGAATENFEWE